MKKIKKPLLFTLSLLPVSAVAGYFVTLYQLDLYDQATVDVIIEQMGSVEQAILIAVVQSMMYAVVCSFFGYMLSDKLGLMKPLRFKRTAVLYTLLFSVVLGVVFSLDYWTFGTWIPGSGIQDSTAAGMTAYGWAASVFYGGIIEELMMRLFLMSLVAWLIWKIFFRKYDNAPAGTLVAANVIAALLFAAGHLPATISIFGELTPMILLRCFLLNGCFGMLFGWLYCKYGIQYAMISHALLHIVSKTIWFIFI